MEDKSCIRICSECNLFKEDSPVKCIIGRNITGASEVCESFGDDMVVFLRKYLRPDE